MADSEKGHQYAKKHHRELNTNIQSMISPTEGNEVVGTHEDKDSMWKMS